MFIFLWLRVFLWYLSIDFEYANYVRFLLIKTTWIRNQKMISIKIGKFGFCSLLFVSVLKTRVFEADNSWISWVRCVLAVISSSKKYISWPSIEHATVYYVISTIFSFTTFPAHMFECALDSKASSSDFFLFFSLIHFYFFFSLGSYCVCIIFRYIHFIWTHALYFPFNLL